MFKAPDAVFSAVRKTVLFGATNPVPFEEVLIDTYNDTEFGFDSTNSYYTVPAPSFYFTHLSAAVPAATQLSFTLRNATRQPNLLLSHTAFDGEVTLSRDDIQWFEANQRLYISSDYTLYSDSLQQVSWSGFRLGFVSHPAIAFSVARKTDFGDKGARVIFDQVFFSLEGAWDPCNNQFKAPEQGIYFLSWSSASVPNEIHTMSLYVNGGYKARSHIHGDYFNGVDTSSQSIVIGFNKGDVAYLVLSDGPAYGPIHSDDNYQTAFMGFYYSPVSGQRISWCLLVTGEFVGPINPVLFDYVMQREGFNWDTSTSSVVIPVDGLYYIKLAGNGLLNEYRFNLVLMLNGEPLFNVMEKVTVLREHENLRNRALITRLKQGDTLTVSLPAGYQIYGEYSDVIFAGFLITPTP